MTQIITLYFLLTTLATPLFSQDTAEAAYLQYYPFNHKIFNLETLEYSSSQEEILETFKTNSKYAARYKSVSIDQLSHQGTLFRTLSDNSLSLKSLTTQKIRTLPNKEKGIPRQAPNLLLAAVNGVICIKSLKANAGYRVYKYDPRGKELFGVEIAHSEFVQHNKLTYYLPYLDYLTHTSKHIVFASYINRIPKTVILNTLDGTLSKFNFSSTAVIKDTKTDLDLDGFIQLNSLNGSITIRYINTTFEYKNPFFKYSTKLETLILDHTLFLIAYNSRSPETRLLAIDVSTQTLKWEAEVTPFGKDATSAYSKTVWLAAYQDKIILESYETKGKSLQIFDRHNGKRLWKSF